MAKNNKFTVETFGSYKHLQGELDSIQVNFIDSNRTEAQNKAIYKKHTHIYYEMIVAEKGVYQSAVNDTMLKMNEGDVILIQPGQTHEDFLQKGTIWYTFHFYLNCAENINFLIFDKNTRPQDQILRLSDADKEFIKTMIKLFESEAKNDIYQSYLIHNALFGAIFRKIISLYSSLLLNEYFNNRHMVQQEAAKITTIFHKNLSKQLTLNDLCKLCAMSRSSLHRTCQIYFNMPPRKAFLHYRMNHIVEFIRKNPHISVKELSSIFGFKNQFHFSRIFKQEIGCYPSFLQMKYKSK